MVSVTLWPAGVGVVYLLYIVTTRDDRDDKKMLLLHPHPVLCGILKELCGIRDNTSSCDIANNNDIVALINDICTSN